MSRVRFASLIDSLCSSILLVFDILSRNFYLGASEFSAETCRLFKIVLGK
jgi:hypothetical protein